MKKTLFIALLALAAVFAAAEYWYDSATTAPGPLAAQKIILIPSGKGMNGIAAALQREGAIRRDLAFLIHARLAQQRAPLKAGEYEIPAAASIAQIVRILQDGKVYQHALTIPEGLTSAEIEKLLEDEPALAGGIAKRPDDGALLPETYHYVYGDQREKILARMAAAMQETLEKLYPARDPALRLTKEEAVVLASIVEKETGVPAERPRIAGVFLNRMKKGMPLQSDPTVIYAITHGTAPLGRALAHDDLKFPSPYNTYLASGLPPAPIANPGKAALEAVLHPEKHAFLYFVADGSGGHYFSKSLQEHNKAVARWRTLNR